MKCSRLAVIALFRAVLVTLVVAGSPKSSSSEPEGTELDSSSPQNQEYKVVRYGPPPTYPRKAQTRGYEGFCILEYTVTNTGAVADIRTVKCSPEGDDYYYRSGKHLFENPSIQSLEKTEYSPRIVDGVPVEVKGVRRQFEFELDQ
jgi:TonB family protein